MKTIKISVTAIAMLLLGIVLCPAQKVYRVDDIPNMRLSDAAQWVSNPDGILSPEAVSRINKLIAEIERTSSAEVAVVAVSSIGNDTPEDFAVRLFEKWGIGKKGSDNGLLILLVSDDRYIRFEVGYGLEGVLTDAICKRIQVRYMNPRFAEGDWDAGMVAGVEAVRDYLADPEASGIAQGDSLAATGSELRFIGNLALIFAVMAVIVVISLLSSRRAKRCPRCKAKMDIVDEQSVRISPGLKRVTTTYRCPKCGYVMKKSRTRNTGGGIAGGLGGGIGGGMIGGGFGGGGSFGGGRSGGGGATSRF